MPTVSTPNLTLSESNGQVTISVRYTATFDPWDRKLTTLGRRYHAHHNVHGWDGGPDLGAVIPDAEITRLDFPVTRRHDRSGLHPDGDQARAEERAAGGSDR